MTFIHSSSQSFFFAFERFLTLPLSSTNILSEFAYEWDRVLSLSPHQHQRNHLIRLFLHVDLALSSGGMLPSHSHFIRKSINLVDVCAALSLGTHACVRTSSTRLQSTAGSPGTQGRHPGCVFSSVSNAHRQLETRGFQRVPGIGERRPCLAPQATGSTNGSLLAESAG